MRTEISFILIMLVLLLTTIGFAKLYENERQKKVRLQSSLKASNQKLQYFTTKNGMVAAKNTVVKLKTSELKESFPHETAEAKNLDISTGRIEHYSETASQTNISFSVPIKDSVQNDSTKVKYFDFHRPELSIRGMITSNSASLNIHSVDTLIQVVYRGKRKNPWLWFFSKRQMEQVISSKNPNTTIVYNRTIQIVKN